MKKIFISFATSLAIFSLAVTFFVSVNPVQAQTVNCPAGYTCTPVAPQFSGCPVGYTCTPVTVSSVTSTPPSTTNSCYSLPTNLYLGSTGSTVANLQTWLMNNGFDIPAVSSGKTGTGYYGSQTVSAIARYRMSSKYLSCVGSQNQAPAVTTPTNPVSSSPIQSTITVTSPKQGDTWYQNSAYTVSWTPVRGDFDDYAVLLSNHVVPGVQGGCPVYVPVSKYMTSTSFNGSDLSDSCIQAWVSNAANEGLSVSENTIRKNFYFTVQAEKNTSNGKSSIVAVGTGGTFSILTNGSTPGQGSTSTVSVLSPASGSVYSVGSAIPITWGGLWSGSDTFSISWNPTGEKGGMIATNLTQAQAGCNGYGKSVCGYSWTPTYQTGQVQIQINDNNTGQVGYSGWFNIGASSVPSQSITVTAPKSGTTIVYNQTLTPTIMWTSTGLGNDNVSISLISAAGNQYPIANNVPNTGSYINWTYDPSVPSGTYQIDVYDPSVKGSISGMSGYFTLNNSGTGSSSTNPPTVDLKANGQDSLAINGSQSVTFTYSSQNAQYCVRSGGSSGWANSNQLPTNSGTYGIELPSSIPVGNNLFTVTCYGSNGLSSSDTVSVVVNGNQKLTVISPNGGEVYYVGQPITVTWSTNISGPSDVILMGYNGDSPTGKYYDFGFGTTPDNFSIVPAGTNQYTFTMNGYMLAQVGILSGGGTFKIKVSQEGPNSLYNEGMSASTFQIMNTASSSLLQN